MVVEAPFKLRVQHENIPDAHSLVVVEFDQKPRGCVFGAEDLEDGDRRMGEYLLDSAGPVKDDDVGHTVARRADLDAKFAADTEVPFFGVLNEPLFDCLLPGGVIVFAHGPLLYLAVDVLRIRLVTGAKVLLHRDERCGWHTESVRGGEKYFY